MSATRDATDAEAGGGINGSGKPQNVSLDLRAQRVRGRLEGALISFLISSVVWGAACAAIVIALGR